MVNSNGPELCPQALLDKCSGLAAVATAVVNAGSELPLAAAKAAQEQGIIDPVLIGDSAIIASLANGMEWDLANTRVVEAMDATTSANLAAAMAGEGEVQALMKGDLHTDTLLRAVLNKSHRLRTDRLLSHVFHMTLPDTGRELCITDAAMNVAPSVADRVEIARNVVGLLHSLGCELPRVAVLSAIEYPSEKIPSSIDAERIVAAASTISGAVFSGPLAMDVAISPQAAQIKGIQGPIAGDADALLVPSIETGNSLFKAMVYLMDAVAAGIVLGARVPIILTSRSDSLASRLASCTLAAIHVANANK